MPSIHLLRLTDDKYYVGRSTRSPYDYLIKHMHGGINEWTTRYIPLQVVSSVASTDYSDLDVAVIEYMLKYGIDNVRGGSYSALEIPELHYNLIQAEMWRINNLCGRCGGEEHEEIQCLDTHDVNGHEIIDDCDGDDNAVIEYDSDDSCFDSSEIDEGYDSYS
uniref:GIY-YIG domain-containing protein n=1 Tax=viral metagenome TaxID=1070528 RepID=A0A6C0ICF5_9ZZZZ